MNESGRRRRAGSRAQKEDMIYGWESLKVQSSKFTKEAVFIFYNFLFTCERRETLIFQPLFTVLQSCRLCSSNLFLLV